VGDERRIVAAISQSRRKAKPEMTDKWAERAGQVAERIVEGLDVQAGEIVEVRDNAGRSEVLLEVLLAIEQRGATPRVELVPPGYLGRLWSEVPCEHLAHWDRHRADWLQQIDRVLTLTGADPVQEGTPSEGAGAWSEAIERLGALEEERGLPKLLVAVPTAARARQLGLSLAGLEAILLPALAVPAAELRAEIERLLAAIEGATEMTLHSGTDHILRLQRGDRPCLSDDGVIETLDRERGAIASNLPAGSIYGTVLEDETEGSLWLPRAAQARDVTLSLHGGRITRIEAAKGADSLRALFHRHTGEPRRVSHVGVGLNPVLPGPEIGWTLVDEHIHGRAFIAFGENRYMGGQNASSLNVDFSLPDATIEVDGKTIVSQGAVVA
jgi:leucyl aminopeptidase (aminopeptidase T)